MTKTDTQLKQDVEDELCWDPRLNAAQIGVSVNVGVVSLFGQVDTYAEKWAAEEATRRVNGVRTVAQDLAVKVLANHTRSDSDIAAATQIALTSNVYIPNSVTAKVENGEVTLQGQVTWNFEREAAERAVGHLPGVVAVNNVVTLKPKTSEAQVQLKVAAALQRQSAVDSRTIHVELHGSTVTLSGHASTWQSIKDAENAAWAAAGVTQVVDRVKLSQ